jgi:AcrR family transcriptional regulator
MPPRKRNAGRTVRAPKRQQPPSAPVTTPAAGRPRGNRGADTRSQLIASGLNVFGRQGFEGASTRTIASGAGANLAAIVYHFGSKEGLHLAVAEHVAGEILARIGPALAAISRPEAAASPEAARAALKLLVGTFVDVMLGDAEAEHWARFIVREQMQPTAAFDVMYRFMGNAALVATRLTAVALGRREDAAVRIRVFTFLGQVLVFRVANALVLRRMEWREIGPRERAQVKKIVLGQIDSILDAELNP